MPRVAVIFTGGTIAMLRDPVAGGNVPALDGAALLARTPGVGEIAELDPIDWGRVPASHMSFAQVLDLAVVVRSQLAREEVAGVVVVQGTDTMEETSFALDLLAPPDKPTVFVGAMRTADAEGHDGPDNLRAAVRAAASPELRGAGVVVVMAGTILPADDVTKVHTDALDTFQALNAGPLGRLEENEVVVERSRRPRVRLPVWPPFAAEPVALVTAAIGEDGTTLRLLAAAGLRGVVVAATGSGNTHPGLLAAAETVMGEGIPVVLASRCAAGSVTPAYAFPGGGATWARAGAILAGTLTPIKARVALALGLGAGLDDPGLRALFASPDGEYVVPR